MLNPVALAVAVPVLPGQAVVQGLLEQTGAVARVARPALGRLELLGPVAVLVVAVLLGQMGPVGLLEHPVQMRRLGRLAQ